MSEPSSRNNNNNNEDGIPKPELDRMHDEYATQFFGFSPVSVTDAIYNAYYDYVHDVLSSTKQFIIQSCSDVISEEKVNQGTEELLQKCLSSLDMVIDKMEQYLCRNMMSVPEHVLLPEDEVHHLSGERMSLEELEKETSLVEQEIRRERIKRASLLVERSKQKMDLAHMNAFQEQLDLVNKIVAKHGVLDCNEYLQFVLEEVQKLSVSGE